MNALQYPLSHLPMLGKGSLLIDVYASGAPTGSLLHFGNVTKFEREIKDDKAKLYQHINQTPKLITQAVKQRDIMLSITGTDFAFDHLAITEMASSKTTLDTGTVAVTGETLASTTAKKKGRFFRTVGRNIGTVVVHQSGSPLVLTTDYTIADPVQGIIYFPLTSGVSDSVAVTIDYTPTSVKLSQVSGGDLPFVLAHLMFSPDPTDGKKIGADFWRVNLSPNGKLGLISDDYGNWELEGMVLDDTANHPLCPYYQLTDYGDTAGGSSNT